LHNIAAKYNPKPDLKPCPSHDPANLLNRYITVRYAEGLWRIKAWASYSTLYRFGRLFYG